MTGIFFIPSPGIILFMQKFPIGVFDSGYGGLTVLREMQIALPENDFIYLGDNLRAPYGPLAFETVYHYTLQCVKWFLEKNCPLVVLACNTASAKALRSIQQNDLPDLDGSKRVLGVIRPTSEVIGEYTRSGHVGVMATAGTVQSGSYLLEIEKFFPGLTVSQEACTEWVNLVETGRHHSPEADEPVKTHISNLLSKDRSIDTILLACTHYPLLMDKIRQFVPKGIVIIEQGNIVAKSLVDYLHRHPGIAEKCSKKGQISFNTTGDPGDFNAHASVFFGTDLQADQVKL